MKGLYPPRRLLRRGHGGSGHAPEGVRQKARRHALPAGQEARAPQRAGVGEGAGLAPMVGEAGRVDGQAVGEHGGAGACAVADVGVGAGGVGLAHPQAKPVVGVRGGAGGRGEAGQPVLVVPGVGEGATTTNL